MKRLFQILAVTLLSATSSELCAQHNWAMAFVEKGQDIPTVVEYHSAQETAENGIVYNRIFDDCYLMLNRLIPYEKTLRLSLSRMYPFPWHVCADPSQRPSQGGFNRLRKGPRPDGFHPGKKFLKSEK